MKGWSEVTRYNKKFILFAVLSMTFLLTAAAGNNVIGMAVSNGQMQVDRAAVTGNANLLEGSSVKTNADPSRIQLSNGSRATLAANSEAQIFADRIVLQKGSSLVASPAYSLQTNGLVVTGAQAQVAVKGGVVNVTATNGIVKVRSMEGVMLASVKPGTALELTPGAGSSTTSTMTGTVRQESGKFLLKDKVTNLDVELRGSNLQNEVGRAIEVTGKATSTANRDSQILEVASLNRLEEAGQSGGARPTSGADGKPEKKPAGGTGSGSSSGSGSATGMSHGAKVALIVAVVGGGAGAGIAFATMSR
ncbi:MAG: hypothetical protein QM757_08970 [Paludibaculum sp.]